MEDDVQRDSEDSAKMMRELRELLTRQKTYTVASQGPEHPWVATMYFASDEHDLYSAIKANSVTLAHIRERPVVALAINGPTPDYFAQALGKAEDLGPLEELPRVRALLIQKAPEIEKFLDNVPHLHAMRISPIEFFITDHRRHISPRVRIGATGTPDL